MRATASGISVVGTSATATAADRVRLRIAVEHSAPEAARALSGSSVSARALQAVLTAAGVAEAAVQTVGVSLDQQWGDAGKVVGYVARQRFSAVTTDIGNAGSLLEELGRRIGDDFRVEGVEVFAHDTAQAADAARAEAFADAERQARALAAQAGRELGAVRSVTSGSPGGPGPMGEGMRMMAKADAFAAGEVSVTESVRVTWDWADSTA